MKEYKILEDSYSNIQKWLNQWRHTYYIEILHIKKTGESQILMVLAREEMLHQ